MTAYVRVRKYDDLRRLVTTTGTQVDIAAAAGLSTTRLNQICVGKKETIAVDKAARLERCLGVPLGTLFEACDGDELRPYISTTDGATDDDGDGEAAPGNTPADAPAVVAA